eukprot:jgi/Tetstr1/427490/TSEL_017616.t1
MHARNADIEAARREAPADIEWPKLDGHHGIPVLNVPLGSPRYVNAYMRGNAEELQEAAVETFAEAVDATVLTAVERLESVLGRGSFNATSSARRYDPFLNDARGSATYAAAVREAWGRLHMANGGHLGDADARVVMKREAEAASGSQKELTAFLDHANKFRLQNEVDELKDMVPDEELSLPAFNVVTGSYDPRSLKSTLREFKTTRDGLTKPTARALATDIMALHPDEKSPATAALVADAHAEASSVLPTESYEPVALTSEHVRRSLSAAR